MNLAELAAALKILNNPHYGRNDQVTREAASKVAEEIPAEVWVPPKLSNTNVEVIDPRVGQITTNGQETIVVFNSKAKK